MKKTKTCLMAILTVLLLSGVVVSSTAQDRRMGVKGGLNLSNLYVDDVDDENARVGFHVGVYGQIFSTETFAIQPELLYTTKGSETEWSGVIDQTVKFNLNYLELPILAVFKLGDAAEIHVGPYFSYLLGANIDTEGDLGGGTEDLDRDNFKSFDFGLTGGFGLNFGAVQVGARYNYGLSEIADSDAAELLLGDSRNSCAQVYVALNLNP
ncbi:MAG: porin family protein [Bacteroidota bacterium]